MRNKALLQGALLSGGVFCLATFVYLHALPVWAAHAAVSRFDAALPDPDQTQWSEVRKQAYDNTLANGEPIGSLAAEAVDLYAPVYDTSNPAGLEGGVAVVAGSVGLHEQGNVILAAHRDGFFRSLKDVELGQQLMVRTAQGGRTYAITGYEIVTPEATGVLSRTRSNQLTLITCYPFYFLGNAPKRFVVYARELE